MEIEEWNSVIVYLVLDDGYRSPKSDTLAIVLDSLYLAIAPWLFCMKTNDLKLRKREEVCHGFIIKAFQDTHLVVDKEAVHQASVVLVAVRLDIQVGLVAHKEAVNQVAEHPGIQVVLGVEHLDKVAVNLTKEVMDNQAVLVPVVVHLDTQAVPEAELLDTLVDLEAVELPGTQVVPEVARLDIQEPDNPDTELDTLECPGMERSLWRQHTAAVVRNSFHLAAEPVGPGVAALGLERLEAQVAFRACARTSGQCSDS